MRKKKELTETEKRDLAMKYEVAEELGLLEQVAELPEKERTVLHLHYWEGYSLREIAGLLGVTVRKTAERKRTEADKADRVDT